MATKTPTTKTTAAEKTTKQRVATRGKTAPNSQQPVKTVTPTPVAPTADKVCAFCGEGRDPKREPVLPAALFIASLQVKPEYESDRAHLSCANAFAKRLLNEVRAPRGRRATATRRAAAPVPFPSFTTDTMPHRTDARRSDTVRSIGIPALAFRALAFDAMANTGAWWNLPRVPVVRDSMRTCYVEAPTALWNDIRDVALRIGDGSMALPVAVEDAGVAARMRRACRTVVERIDAPSDDAVSSIRF